MKGWIVVVVATLLSLLHDVVGHGRLLEPVSRSSMWRKGYSTPKNYNDNQLFCGGFYNQEYRNHGKCGVCGDPYQGPRQNEAGGLYATGQIVRTYTSGQVIDIEIEVTANHVGWFEFRLCANNNPNKAITHECLNQHLLEFANGEGTRHKIGRDTGMYKLKVKLPRGLTCTQCVLQWKWHTGNSYGVDLFSRLGCVGCGAQEEFYGCSDVAITGQGSQGQPQQVVTSNPHQATVYQPTYSPPVYHTPQPVNPQPVYPLNPQLVYPQTQHPFVYKTTNRRPVYLQTQRPPFYQTTHLPAFIPVQTQRPVVSQSNCRAVNLWVGIPRLDKWCVDNCAVGRCPPIYCDCS